MDLASLQENLRLACFAVPIVLVAFAYHEMAHAYAATWFGDPTPAQHGRRTLNPIKHLDPIGSIMIVVSMVLFGFPFGFAVTPVNDSKMRKPRLHSALTALAGPLVNIAFVVVGALALVWVVENVNPDNAFHLGDSDLPLVFEMAFYTTVFNAFLAVFNLLPIPPLDGSRVVGAFMSDHTRREWRKIDEYGIFIILALVFLGGSSFSAFLTQLQRALLNVVGNLTGNPGLENLI